MRGIVYDGSTTQLIDGIELAEPGPRDVIVDIAAAGLCQSDLSYMAGLYPVPSPAVCGHEGAGVVSAVGEAVTNVRVGDHVVIATLAACGACEYCADGRPTACRATLGRTRQPFTKGDDSYHTFAGTSAFAEQTLVSDINDAKNLGFGDINYWGVEGNVGAVDKFIENGGASIRIRRIG